MVTGNNLVGVENFAYEDNDKLDEVKTEKNGQNKVRIGVAVSDIGSIPAEVEVDDPFAVVDDFNATGPKWDELDTFGKIKRVLITTLKACLLFGLLYLFICSLGFLQSAFQLLGGKAAGQAFTDNTILSNSVAGLMIGVLATVLLQSSSTTTSIVVAMVASGIMKVRPAIPIVMGANIGTSVTNTLVAIGQIGDVSQFRRAFAGATVHDMFNFLCVSVLLPLEAITGYLFHLTDHIVNVMDLKTSGKHGMKKEFLSKLTKPFTHLIVQLNEQAIVDMTTHPEKKYKTLIKQWCDAGEDFIQFKNQTFPNGTIKILNETVTKHYKQCKFLLHGTNLSDHVLGAILLVIALIILCSCLVSIVKLLHSLLKGQIAVVIRKTFNSDFPKPFGFLTGYVAILVGMGMTILVQSSSIFTSALTPLVGLGLVSVERIYPLTLGANIGTTATGILAAMASEPDRLAPALQISFCHLFFNISGILLFYPIPQLRKIPTKLARGLGNTTAKYRWFAIAYLIFGFFVIPTLIFGLSVAGTMVLVGVATPILCLIVFIAIVNLLQVKKPEILPTRLRTWSGVPIAFRSLEPYDRVISKVYSASSKLRTRTRSLVEVMDNKETTTV